MKMKTTIQLDSKDVRIMIAGFLGCRMEDVIPNRYNFSVAGVGEAEIERKLTEAENTMNGKAG